MTAGLGSGSMILRQNFPNLVKASLSPFASGTVLRFPFWQATAMHPW